MVVAVLEAWILCSVVVSACPFTFDYVNKWFLIGSMPQPSADTYGQDQFSGDVALTWPDKHDGHEKKVSHPNVTEQGTKATRKSVGKRNAIRCGSLSSML